ncbi:MAG: hypothetical protein QM765_04345 [Myxococcales bacterium]
MPREKLVSHGLAATCMRFDSKGVLLHQGLDPRQREWLQRRDVQLREAPEACFPNQDWEKRPAVSPVNDVPRRPTVAEGRIVWQHASASWPAYQVPLDRVGLPNVFPLPTAQPDHPWVVEPTTPRLLVASDTLHELFPDGRTVEHPLPVPGAMLFRAATGDALMAGRYPPKSAEKLLLSLGTRSAPGAAYTWKDLQAVTNAVPDFGLVQFDSRSVAVVAGHRYGLQWADATTGKLLARQCSTGTTPEGKCVDDWYLGPVAELAPGRVWVFHAIHPNAAERQFAFEEIDVTSRKVVRSVPTPALAPFTGPDDFRTGVLSVGPTLWAAGQNLIGRSCIALARLAPEPVVTSFCVPGAMAYAIEASPDGRFFAISKTTGLELYRPTGELAFTLGIRGKDSFAFARDGRFACTGEACQSLHCVVAGAVLPADAPECARLRRDGFNLDAEFSASSASKGH